ncbi:hypothetical protein ADL01_15205 [Streptomyces sp. NRRL WC-3618]|uniref:hypothetical protein n=1 Tax=Streptomyces sp. NRRL WC-3618 TaxID=1519490 RepID=UPI0006AE0996|nr:hypothetical protein [Streptomyces sp. NRRL WC-3618]KOV78290.1 hypothetical protein ADL01_15205 [Streptomyces sp. NRRL WC-3618]
MDSTFLAALIAATVTAGGWLANHLLSARADVKRRKAEARLTHVENQLEQLYGPLLFLVKEGRSAWMDFLDTLGRNYVFASGIPLSPEERDLWLFWVDHEFMPRNEAIQDLLAAKTHLMAGDQMPDSYLAFIHHHNSWRVTHQRWKEREVEYSWKSKANWPDSFETDVIATYERLKNLQIQMAGLVRGEEA